MIRNCFCKNIFCSLNGFSYIFDACFYIARISYKFLCFSFKFFLAHLCFGQNIRQWFQTFCFGYSRFRVLFLFERSIQIFYSRQSFRFHNLLPQFIRHQSFFFYKTNDISFSCFEISRVTIHFVKVSELLVSCSFRQFFSISCDKRNRISFIQKLDDTTNNIWCDTDFFADDLY